MADWRQSIHENPATFASRRAVLKGARAQEAFGGPERPKDRAMKRVGFLGWVALGASSLSAFAACQLESERTDTAQMEQRHAEAITTGSAAAELPDRFSVTVPWGKGAEELRLDPAGPESMAYGPNAVALSESGESLILDRLGERIVRVGPDGKVRTFAAVPRDAEELVASATSVVAFSPLRARAWFFDAAGQSAGEMQVPRELRELTRLSVGPSRRLSVHTGFQERLELGSPSAPLALEVTLRSKREGAHILPDGSGVAVRATKGRAELVQISQAEGNVRSRVLRASPLTGEITAARIVGGEAETVCLRTERVRSLPEIAVDRRALCVNAVSGAVLFDEALPAPGVYLPRTELAFRAGRLSHIHASTEGLVVTNLAVFGGEVTK